MSTLINLTDSSEKPLGEWNCKWCGHRNRAELVECVNAYCPSHGLVDTAQHAFVAPPTSAADGSICMVCHTQHVYFPQ